MFMRAVKSRTFFEQMKGRGVRVINPATCRGNGRRQTQSTCPPCQRGGCGRRSTLLRIE